jgi:tetraprenyl-beta-curcumene synthase
MGPQTDIDPMTGLGAVGTGDRAALATAFAGAARRYWTNVFPRVRRELSYWKDHASEIPDPVLRRLALDALNQHGNMEGAAAFAAFAPRSQRAAVVRALVAFQSAYNYLDLLAEQPRAEPVAGARALHEALLVAVDPAPGTRSLGVGTGSPDYYAHYPHREDNGYLAELAETCRTALATLPSYPSVAKAARRATERIVEFQSLNLSETQGEHDAFARWARAETPSETDLRWWETAAAGGSSLGVYALIAAAAHPVARQTDVQAIENAYFPWIGALHSLLDHLVDKSEDTAAGQRSLIGYYASPQDAATRMRVLAERAVYAAGALPRPHRHMIILAGMAGYYLSDPEASAPSALPVARNVRTAIGRLMAPTLLVFKARQLAGRAGAQRADHPLPRRPSSKKSTSVRERSAEPPRIETTKPSIPG